MSDYAGVRTQHAADELTEALGAPYSEELHNLLFPTEESESMIVMGIDPGLKGGVSFMLPAICQGWKMPVKHKIIDVGRLQELIISHAPVIAYVEKQRIMSRQAGALTTGSNYGRILATLELCGIQYLEITPQTWQKKLFLTGRDNPYKKQIGYDFCVANGYFVPMTSSRANASFHDGVSDAHCIAHYGMESQHIDGVIVQLEEINKALGKEA